MEDFTTNIEAKVAVLTEYGVSHDAARIIAGTNHLDEIHYLARRVEGDGSPDEAAARIVAFFEMRDNANMFFASMRRTDHAAAEYAVGVRNETSAKYSPDVADIVAGLHSDLDASQDGYAHELNYRLVKLYDVRQRIAAGEAIPKEELATWDRFHAFIPRLRDLR